MLITDVSNSIQSINLRLFLALSVLSGKNVLFLALIPLSINGLVRYRIIVCVLPVMSSLNSNFLTVKWDPLREDMTFLTQSATLYAEYYTIQIMVHRLFISSPRRPSPSSFPSLTICTNAARSCIHVLYVQFQRTRTCGQGYEVRVSAYAAISKLTV